MIHRVLSKTPRLMVWTLAVLSLAAVPASRAAERGASKAAGFVDGSAFAELAGEDSEMVEIHIQEPLLRALSRADTEDEGFGEFLRNLKGINAYIVGLEDDPERVERATRMVREMETKLEHQGWERLAVVREKEARVNVYIRNDDERIDGLVVLAVDRDESKVVFANIAGTIDLARLGELGETLKVPGLEAVGEAVGKDKPAAPKRKKERRKEPEP